MPLRHRLAFFSQKIFIKIVHKQVLLRHRLTFFFFFSYIKEEKTLESILIKDCINAKMQILASETIKTNSIFYFYFFSVVGEGDKGRERGKIKNNKERIFK